MKNDYEHSYLIIAFLCDGLHSPRQEVTGEGSNREGDLGSETRELEDEEAMVAVGAIIGVISTAGVSLAAGVETGEDPLTAMDIKGLKASIATEVPVRTELLG